jgi:hypothetical protein
MDFALEENFIDLDVDTTGLLTLIKKFGFFLELNFFPDAGATSACGGGARSDDARGMNA